MNDTQLFKLVKAGDLDALVEATAGDEEDDDEANEDAYKWLQIAADFGLKRARAMADDLLEATSHGYDDGGMVVALIHLELGQAYLRGEAPLPVDHAKAKFHLGIAQQAEVHKTTDVAKGFDAFRNKLGAEARELFDAHFPAKSVKKKPAAKRSTKPKR